MDEASRIAKMARELIAVEYDREGMTGEAACVRDGHTASLDEECALRAITAAYNKGRADMREEAAAWQDIATAPKDGKCVVWCATDDGGEMRILDRTSEGDWLYEGQETFCHGFYIEPTHWRPLPDPPAAIRAIPVGDE